MTGIIIPAAGSSSRLGRPKQNLEYRGATLLQHTVQAALATRCPVTVVLGANPQLILPTIESLPADIIINDNWQQGMATSIRAGLNRMLETAPNLSSVILMLCDQPFVTAGLLLQLIQEATTEKIAACAYNDTIGPPACFDRAYFPELQSLGGTDGAKHVLLRNAAHVTTIPFPSGGVDIDTLEDYEKLKGL